MSIDQGTDLVRPDMIKAMSNGLFTAAPRKKDRASVIHDSEVITRREVYKGAFTHFRVLAVPRRTVRIEISGEAVWC